MGRFVMKKNMMLLALFVCLVFSASRCARADFGACEDSPENPTLVLAGLASGAFAISAVRTRIRARQRPKIQ
jgi:XrtJ-associated TM-motif-TM protein